MNEFEQPTLVFMQLGDSQLAREFVMPFWGRPRSFIVSAKKRGLLAGVVSVNPLNFGWNGHEIRIRESWLQKSTEISLVMYFTLDVDGKPQVTSYSEQSTLIFVENETEYAYSLGRLSVRHGLESMKAFIPIPGVGANPGWTIHYATFLKDRVPPVISLRAGTEENFERVLSEAVLAFELPYT